MMTDNTNLIPSVEKLPDQVLDDVLDKNSDEGDDDQNNSQAFFRDPNAVLSDSGSPVNS